MLLEMATWPALKACKQQQSLQAKYQRQQEPQRKKPKKTAKKQMRQAEGLLYKTAFYCILFHTDLKNRCGTGGI